MNWNTILKDWKTAGLDKISWKEDGGKIIQRNGRNGKWELTNGKLMYGTGICKNPEGDGLLD